MHSIRLVICLAVFLPMGVAAQSADDLLMDDGRPDDVLTYGMGYKLQRFSTLKQINTRTIADLVPAWSFSLGSEYGQEAQPLLYAGVLYVTSPEATYAIEAGSGRRMWTHRVEYAANSLRATCCGIINRGAAIYQGRLYRQTLDNYVIALDIATGEEIWKQRAADWADGYSMTGTPLIANGVVVTGVSGAEFGVRCFLDGWDAQTGEHLWRRYTVPQSGEPGSDTWSGAGYKIGGGSTWLTGSYDPDLDLVYWGTGNPSPWSAARRHGDNLYTNSVLAFRPRTGELVWYYQFTPNDTFDFDGANELIQASLSIDGHPREVIMQANRNGYFYVLDRATGELLRSYPFVDQLNWSDGIDPETGRPVRSQLTRDMLEHGTAVEIWPSALGGKNWAPASYSPETGLVYVNANEVGMNFKPVDAEWVRGAHYMAMEFQFVTPEAPIGRLRAFDPVTGRRAWEVAIDPPPMGGTLVTAGGLVFTGLITGELVAHDARSGAELWHYQTGSGIIAPPVSYAVDGVQYVAVVSGIGGLLPLVLPVPGTRATNPGGLLTVFRLHRGAAP